MTDKEILKCGLSDIKMSSEPNKMVIEGCITKIGEPSTGSPCGADGKLVVFTNESVQQCAKSFVGMPLNCTFPDSFWGGAGSEVFTGHGDMNIGYIRKVKAVDNNLMAELVVWKEKFPEEAFMIVNGMDALGFSVEWYATKFHDDDAQNIRYMEEFEGIGCALLWKNVAAFGETFISKLAAMKQNRGDSMNDKEKKELIDSVMGAVQEKVDAAVKAGIEELTSKVEERTKEIMDSMETTGQALEDKKAEFQASLDNAVKMLTDKVEKIEADAKQMKAEAAATEEAEQEEAEVKPMEASTEMKDIPAPTATQSVVPNPVISAADEKEKKISEIQASSMTGIEKIRAITKLRFA